ncbi:hypothetical protein DSUL_100167 [Desulfovibrionales bacterium]
MFFLVVSINISNQHNALKFSANKIRASAIAKSILNTIQILALTVHSQPTVFFIVY